MTQTRYAMIATWKMSYEGMQRAEELLRAGGDLPDAVETAVRAVEDNPSFQSVGYGGLPARDGRVRLDAGWMRGDDLRCGAIMAAEDISSPVRAARLLCGRELNWMLAGEGARQFAGEHGIPMRSMLTDRARERWADASARAQGTDRPYDGHDTVCVIGMQEGHMVAATSTSGLFMKELGRVGDSPIPGSGYYCDSRVGAAAATGLGEDIMRGCLSFQVVSLMRSGMAPQKACEAALGDFVRTKRALGEEECHISLIAMDHLGHTGAATSEKLFPFVVSLPGKVQLWRCEAGDRDGEMRTARAEMYELDGAD
ncbi:MAG: isoaspartyl peptidase/L-asparaginase [Clostridia bacterium]|nr:isoaspartyl peptidase/L-asparaginase [Clostridia bacterium]